MSGKTVAQKLSVKPGARLWSSDPERVHALGALPEATSLVDDVGDASVAVIFAPDGASLRATLAEHAAQLAAPGVLWVAYPKGNVTDINRDSVWPMLAEHGMRPISQVAIDDVWSALRFRPLKEGEEQFTGGKFRA